MRYLDKYSVRDKTLLHLEAEANRLRQAQWNAPIVPVEHPCQRGWVKFFMLREDVLRRPDVAAFCNVLEAVNDCIYSSRRTFLDPGGKPIILLPHIIQADEWRRLAWPVSRQRFFIYGRWEKRYTSHRQAFQWRTHVYGYNLRSTWWLEEAIQPNIITHQQVDLPEVKKRLIEIETYMKSRNGYDRLRRLHGHKQWWRIHQKPAWTLRAAVTGEEQLNFTGDE